MAQQQPSSQHLAASTAGQADTAGPADTAGQADTAGPADTAGTAGHAGAEPDADWLIESIERRVEAFDADAGEPAEAEIGAALPGAEHDGPPVG